MARFGIQLVQGANKADLTPKWINHRCRQQMRDFSPRGLLCSLSWSAPVSPLHGNICQQHPGNRDSSICSHHMEGRDPPSHPRCIAFSFVPANCRTLSKCMHASSQEFLVFVEASILVMALARGTMLNTFLFPPTLTDLMATIYLRSFFAAAAAAWGRLCICRSSMCKPSDPEQLFCLLGACCD